MEPRSCSELIDLNVVCLNGEGCRLKLSNATLGQEVYQTVSKQLPQKPGKLALHHVDSPLVLQQPLQEQGIVGAATLTCTYVPTDLDAAWCFILGKRRLPPKLQELLDELLRTEDLAGATEDLDQRVEMILFEEKSDMKVFAEDDAQGLTQIGGIDSEMLGRFKNLPESLESLTFGWRFNQSLERVTLPSRLKTLAFGDGFDQSLELVVLPSTLEILTFGHNFNQSLERVTLPSSLQILTFGHKFNQSLEGVTLPISVESLTFGHCFDQSLQRVTLPSSLQSLTFGDGFNRSLERVTLSSTLQSLTLGDGFNQCLVGVSP